LIAPFNGVLIYSFAAMFNFTEGPVFVKGSDDGVEITFANKTFRLIGRACRRATVLEFRRGKTFPTFFRFPEPGRESIAMKPRGASRLSPCAAFKIMERFA
jgi:hypothetical protein